MSRQTNPGISPAVDKAMDRFYRRLAEVDHGTPEERIKLIELRVPRVRWDVRQYACPGACTGRCRS